MPLKTAADLLSKEPAPPPPPPAQPPGPAHFEEVERVALPEGLTAVYLRRVS